MHIAILVDLVGYDSKVQLQPEHGGLPASVWVWLVMFVHLCILFESSTLTLDCRFTCFRWPRNFLSSTPIEPSVFQALLMLPALWNANWLSLLLMVIFTPGCLFLKTYDKGFMSRMCIVTSSSWKQPRCYWIAITWCIGWHVCVHRSTWSSFQQGSCESISMGSYSTGSGFWNPFSMILVWLVLYISYFYLKYLFSVAGCECELLWWSSRAFTGDSATQWVKWCLEYYWSKKLGEPVLSVWSDCISSSYITSWEVFSRWSLC